MNLDIFNWREISLAEFTHIEIHVLDGLQFLATDTDTRTNKKITYFERERTKSLVKKVESKNDIKYFFCDDIQAIKKVPVQIIQKQLAL